MSAEGDQLAAALELLGASADQSRVMAAQMRKRAKQLAAERGVTEAEALRGLLEIVVAGRSGETLLPRGANASGSGASGDISGG